MQALEKIGVLESDEDRKGRRITEQGQRDLDRMCLVILFRVAVLTLCKVSLKPLSRLMRTMMSRRLIGVRFKILHSV